MPRMMLAPAALAAAVLIAPQAEAQRWRDRDWKSIRVDASALDLSTSTGKAELARRVHRAVNRICGSDRWCRDEAWESTEAQVAYAIERDEWMRGLAEERAAQLRRCGYDGCPPQPAYHAPPPPPPPPPTGGVTITIIHSGPPPQVQVWPR